MSIADKMNTLITEVRGAYTSIQNKGGMIPSSKNTQNLEDAILSIPAAASDLYMHNILLYIVGHNQDGNMLIVNSSKDPMTYADILMWLNANNFKSTTTTYPAWGSGTQKDIYEFASSSTSTKSKYTISPYMPSGIFVGEDSSTHISKLKVKVLQSGTQEVQSVVDNVIKIS